MSLIKSQLIQNITDQNPHLYIKDVERIVNTIFSEITKSLSEGNKLFGAEVVECVDGTGEKGVLKDACTSVLKAWSSDPEAFYCCGSAIGPHPFPKIVQYAQGDCILSR